MTPRRHRPSRIGRYPNVSCRDHPDPRPGYSVCSHVVAGARVVVWLPPTLSALGHVACVQAVHGRDDAVIACAQCAMANGWVPS